MTFRTAGPPAVSNQVSSNVTPTEATVSASVDTKGLRTSYRIEWGTSTRYGRFTPVVSADSGIAAANVTLTGLQPNRTYHWRTRASNAAGTSLGANRTFRTAPLPSAVTLSLSRSTVPWGGDVRLGGRVSGAGVGGMTVALEQQRLGVDPGFSETATARTGSDGGYLFTIPRLWTTTSYRVVTKTQVVATSPVATARSRVTGRRPRPPRRAQAGARRGLDLARRAGHGRAPALPVRPRLADGPQRDARPHRPDPLALPVHRPAPEAGLAALPRDRHAGERRACAWLEPLRDGAGAAPAALVVVAGH